MTDHVICESEDSLLWLRLNRPEKRNALTMAMYAALADALQAAEANPEVRVVIITGTPDCFTSGNDLADFLANPPRGEDMPVARFLNAISSFTKPIIAAVAGPAVGIGSTLLLHCDLVYAADNAAFQFPFTNIGLVPEAGSSLLLPRLVGMAKATELLFFGETFDADTALELGLINGVAAADGHLDFVRARALKLAAQPAAAIRETKKLLRQGRTGTVNERIREESDIFSARLRSPEAIEAMTAFMEKRAPDFSRFN